MSEMYSDIQQDAEMHPHTFAPSTDLLLQLARDHSAASSVKAARFKTRLIACFQEALSQVDVIALPTTKTWAPHIAKDLDDSVDEVDIVKVV